MEKKRLISLLIILFLFTSIAGSFVLSNEIYGIKKNSLKIQNSSIDLKVDSMILEQFNKGEETVRVIVQLKDEIEVVEKREFGLLNQTKKIKVSRDEVIETLNMRGKIGHRFSSFNGFSTTLTKEETEKLKQNEAVERISFDYPVTTFLQNSTEIINATSTWDLQAPPGDGTFKWNRTNGLCN
jgi:hypothetical protein